MNHNILRSGAQKWQASRAQGEYKLTRKFVTPMCGFGVEIYSEEGQNFNIP